jgi:hypothetical protein
MTDWYLRRAIAYLAVAVAAAGSHYKSIAEEHRKPGHHGADDPRFWPNWLEFYTPKGQFYLRLGRWLHFAAFVIGVSWIYLFVYK